jgi:hypothetical protein
LSGNGGSTAKNAAPTTTEPADQPGGVTPFVKGDNPALSLPAGGARTLSPYADAKTPLTYTSSDPSVATVSATGRIDAKSPGSAVITVKDKDGVEIARIPVTITAPAASGSGSASTSGSTTTTSDEVKGAESIVCRKTDKLPSQGQGWYHFAFTAAECGGTLPDDTYAGSLAKTELCGTEESLLVLQPGEAFTSQPAFISDLKALKDPLPMQGPGMALYSSAPCADKPSPSFLEVVYMKKTALQSIVCRKTNEYPTGTGWQHFTFTAAECGGTLPDKSYLGSLAKTEVCGSEESMQVLQPDEAITARPAWISEDKAFVDPLPMQGPGVAFVAHGSCPAKSDSLIEVVYTRAQGKETIVCNRSTMDRTEETGWYHFTYTAEECSGGVLPDASYAGTLAKTEACGAEESIVVLQPGESLDTLPPWISVESALKTPLPMKGPGIAVVAKPGCPNVVAGKAPSALEVVFTKRLQP